MSYIINHFPQFPTFNFNTAFMTAAGIIVAGPAGGVIGYTVAAVTEKYNVPVNKFMHGMIDGGSITKAQGSADSPLHNYTAGSESVAVSFSDGNKALIRLPASKIKPDSDNSGECAENNVNGLYKVSIKNLRGLLNDMRTAGGVFIIFTLNTLQTDAFPASGSNLSIRDADSNDSAASNLTDSSETTLYNATDVTNGTAGENDEEDINASGIALIAGVAITFMTLLTLLGAGGVAARRCTENPSSDQDERALSNRNPQPGAKNGSSASSDSGTVSAVGESVNTTSEPTHSLSTEHQSVMPPLKLTALNQSDTAR